MVYLAIEFLMSYVAFFAVFVSSLKDTHRGNRSPFMFVVCAEKRSLGRGTCYDEITKPK